MGSLEPFHGQSVTGTVGDARKNAELQYCWQKGTKTCLHGVIYKPFFCGREVVDCATRRKLSFTAWEVLSHRALS